MKKEQLSLLIQYESDFCHGIVFDDISPFLIANKIITVDEYTYICKQRAEQEKIKLLLRILPAKGEGLFNKFLQKLKENYSSLAEKIEQSSSADPDEVDTIVCERNAINDTLMVKNTSANNIYKSTTDNIVCDSITKNSNHKVHVKNFSRQFKSIPYINQVRSKCNIKKSKVYHEVITDEMISVIKKNAQVVRDWNILAHSLRLSDAVCNIREKVLIHQEDRSMCVVYLLNKWVEEKSKDATLMNLINVLRGEKFNLCADNLIEKFV